MQADCYVNIMGVAWNLKYIYIADANSFILMSRVTQCVWFPFSLKCVKWVVVVFRTSNRCGI